MAEEKTKKKSFLEGLKTEFGKIVWPSGKAVTKQTVATVIVSIVLGLIISAIDLLVQMGVDVLINL